MCGIVGVFHYAGGQPDRERLERQAAALVHRGPDGAGFWQSGPVAFGHRRLAIVGLGEDGRQPMANEDARVHVTFNGELYGWRAQRTELAGRGHVFRGRSDTEVLVHLYEEHGLELPARLRGEFAFAVHDATRARLLLARDRAGVKPLYWHDDGRRLVFASELKALMRDPSVPREVDEAALAEYLATRYVAAPLTIWKGVRKLAAGHRLVCDARGPVVDAYWTLPVGAGSRVDEREASEQLRGLLHDAVRERMVADVPVGAFLSGGIDSGTVVALMARHSDTPVRTFSVGFEELEFSELAEARRLADHVGADHHEFVVRPDALAILPELVAHLDEPFADASILPSYYLAAATRGEVKVVLSGDGGDEAFCGYATYAAAQRHHDQGAASPGLNAVARAASAWLHPDTSLARRTRRLGMSVLDRHVEAMAVFPPRELSHVLSPALGGRVRPAELLHGWRATHARASRDEGPVAGLLHLDAVTWLAEDVLRKVDAASMMHSLEVRVPLLDHLVLEFAAGLPFGMKLRAGRGKWILREAVRELLPPATLERPKRGFNAPLERWLGGGFGRLARETLLDPRARARGWLRPSAVDRLLDPRAGRGSRAQQLWSLVCLELWAQAHLDAH